MKQGKNHPSVTNKVSKCAVQFWTLRSDNSDQGEECSPSMAIVTPCCCRLPLSRNSCVLEKLVCAAGSYRVVFAGFVSP